MDTLRNYLLTLTPAEQEAYARRCGTSIGYLRKALSNARRSPGRRAPFKGALVRLLWQESGGQVDRYELLPDVFDPPASAVDITSQVDLRMSKRALRARLGLSTDKQLAKVLQLPAEQVESWEEERALPAVPEVLRLLGAQAPAAPAPQEPEDPDASRIVPVETA